MKQRDRQRQKATSNVAHVPPAAPPSDATRWYRERRVWLAAGIVAVIAALTVSYRMWNAAPVDSPRSSAIKNPVPQDPDDVYPDPDSEDDMEDFSGHKGMTSPQSKNLSENFLDAFNDKDPKTDNEKDGAALADAELEKRFHSLTEINDRLEALKKRVVQRGPNIPGKEYKEILASRNKLRKDFNRAADSLAKEVARAKRQRGQDAVPRWLSGELLNLVGGEPEEILPHLEFALAHGLQRPRLFGSLSAVELRANRFAESHRHAEQALDQSGQDRYLWTAFGRSAFCAHQFEEVVKRLDKAFPDGLPDWAKAIHGDAEDLQAKWEIEKKLRVAEAKASDLPRVRLLIEHRRFARDAEGKPLTTIETTGRGEVILELFENEAPQTVANFVDLVTQKFYDGTSFHLALPATLVGGGDPNTKNDDPADDGTGNPGYFIADEFLSSSARNHFRGSISMVNNGPHTTGSQFFLCLAPQQEMNGHFTVFGRVLQGQDIVDRITRGRTTRLLGQYGRIIPGDLLVRAEVVRQRNHPYHAIKK